MAGLNLLTIGTALGGFLGGYDDARQKQQKQQQEQLKSLAAMQMFRQQQQDRQRETQAATGYVKSAQDLPDLSGLGMGQPGGAPTGWGGMPQQPQPRDLTAGLTPARPAAQPASFSPPQQSGGAASGGPVTLPSGQPLVQQSPTVPANARYGGNEQADRARIEGMNDAGVGKSPIPLLNTPEGRQMADMGAGTVGAAQPAQPDVQIPSHVQQQVQQGAQQTARGIDPMVQGRMSLKALAQTVEKNMPAADPVAKAMVLEKLSKALAPSEQQMWKQFALDNRQDFQLALKDMQIQAAGARQDKSIAATDARGADKGWTTMETTGADGKRTPVRVQASTGKVEPLQLPGGAASLTRTGTAAQAAVSPQARSLMADGIANYQLPPLASWALKSPEGQATMAEVMKKNPDYDATKYTGKQSGARAMGTRSASLTMATDVAEEQIPLVQQTSERIDRTQYPTINSMILAMDKGTGGEDIVRFLEQINTLKYVYARALNPTGTARIQDLERFDNILNEAWSKGQISAALDQMKISLAAERRGVDRAMTGKPATDNAAKPGASAPPSTPGGEEVIQNGWRYRKEGEQYVPVGPAQ